MVLKQESGVALVLALLTITLLGALGAALVVLSSSERVIAANFSSSAEAFYAADAMIERALVDLRGVMDWTPALRGDVRSSFADGSPAGVRRLSDGSLIDLDQITNLASCQKLTACRDADLNAISADRPRGVNNPRWKAFVYGWLGDSRGPETAASPFYGVVFVGDDPSEIDGDPTTDGGNAGEVASPGRGRLLLRAEAFGPRGAHKVVESAIARIGADLPDPGPVLMISWREVR